MPSNARSKPGPPTAAQKRLAAERAAAARERIAVAQRRRRLGVILGAVGAIVIVVAALVIVKVVNGNSPKSGVAATSANASVVDTLSSIPQSTFDKIGTGGATAAGQAPKSVQAALTSGGKPELLYIGAEWCPICAAERWPMALTLQRFGTLRNLGAVRSSPTDSAPDTATLSFHGASYSSPYITFVGKEIYSNQADGSQYKTLDKLTSSQAALFKQVTGFPYLNMGGKYVLNTAQYDPTVLGGSSMDQKQIAKAIADPSTKISKDVVGSANVLTAQVCQLTNQKPAKVCSSTGVQAAVKALGK